MSTKAKIGKDWVKCQIVLTETGETLHLTFAPGQSRKRVVVHIDGRTDTGYIELAGLEEMAPPYDAELRLEAKGEGLRAKAKPAAKPAPAKAAAPPAAPKPVAPAVKVEPVQPPPVEAPAAVPQAVEETPVSEVQDSAATDMAVGGKRGKKPAAARDE